MNYQLSIMKNDLRIMNYDLPITKFDLLSMDDEL